VAVLERGDIYFAYRPRVDAKTVASLDDVQRFYLILHSRGKGSYRLLVVGQKRLPVLVGNGDRKAWTFVDKVSTHPEDVEDELDPKRERSAARPCGEGVYAIVRHRNHTHLAYVLELPQEPGEVQRALNIAKEASYVATVRNPKAPAAPGTGLDETRRARFPRPLQMRFRGRRFVNLDPPDYLDHEGAELLLVGARPTVFDELGHVVDPEQETEATAEIFNDLLMEKSLHPVAPLLAGRWE
jgi:hypothetical protein